MKIRLLFLFFFSSSSIFLFSLAVENNLLSKKEFKTFLDEIDTSNTTSDLFGQNLKNIKKTEDPDSAFRLKFLTIFPTETVLSMDIGTITTNIQRGTEDQGIFFQQSEKFSEKIQVPFSAPFANFAVPEKYMSDLQSRVQSIVADNPSFQYLKNSSGLHSSLSIHCKDFHNNEKVIRIHSYSSHDEFLEFMAFLTTLKEKKIAHELKFSFIPSASIDDFIETLSPSSSSPVLSPQNLPSAPQNRPVSAQKLSKTPIPIPTKPPRRSSDLNTQVTTTTTSPALNTPQVTPTTVTSSKKPLTPPKPSRRSSDLNTQVTSTTTSPALNTPQLTPTTVTSSKKPLTPPKPSRRSSDLNTQVTSTTTSPALNTPQLTPTTSQSSKKPLAPPIARRRSPTLDTSQLRTSPSSSTAQISFETPKITQQTRSTGDNLSNSVSEDIIESFLDDFIEDILIEKNIKPFANYHFEQTNKGIWGKFLSFFTKFKDSDPRYCLKTLERPGNSRLAYNISRGFLKNTQENFMNNLNSKNFLDSIPKSLLFYVFHYCSTLSDDLSNENPDFSLWGDFFSRHLFKDFSPSKIQEKEIAEKILKSLFQKIKQSFETLRQEDGFDQRNFEESTWKIFKPELSFWEKLKKLFFNNPVEESARRLYKDRLFSSVMRDVPYSMYSPFDNFYKSFPAPSLPKSEVLNESNKQRLFLKKFFFALESLKKAFPNKDFPPQKISFHFVDEPLTEPVFIKTFRKNHLWIKVDRRLLSLKDKFFSNGLTTFFLHAYCENLFRNNVEFSGKTSLRNNSFEESFNTSDYMVFEKTLDGIFGKTFCSRLLERSS